ncbi:hypothetical protein GOODEAATRI_006026 [Goodea atripinnis]|uniref:Uncharacterized protein n=1 Tax=Goodea atripinnis TaxID=208336 RepID=A0ABV0MPR7_9TELE
MASCACRNAVFCTHFRQLVFHCGHKPGDPSLHAGQSSARTIPRSPKLAIWNTITAGHMRLARASQVKGMRLKLKGKVLASASGQASRCGDPDYSLAFTLFVDVCLSPEARHFPVYSRNKDTTLNKTSCSTPMPDVFNTRFTRPA